jgi:sec-independent protein translocase protein TatA
MDIVRIRDPCSLFFACCLTIIDNAVYAAARENFVMGDLFQPTHLIILAIVVLVLFGGRKLPELGKGLGEGLRGFKEGMKGVTDEMNKPTEDSTHAVTPKPTETAQK